MAQKENKYKGCGINTQSVHTGTDYDAETGAIRRPPAHGEQFQIT